MTREDANFILDDVRAGEPVSQKLIAEALKATGDLPQDWPAGIVPADPLEVV